MPTLKELQRQAFQQAEDAGWHEDRPNVGPEALRAWQGMKIALMHSELSEALEELRDGRHAYESYYPKPQLPASLVAEVGVDEAEKIMARQNAGKPRKPEGVPSELADVVIRVLDFCGTEGIDLESIVVEKLEYNKTRAYKHGRNF